MKKILAIVILLVAIGVSLYGWKNEKIVKKNKTESKTEKTEIFEGEKSISEETEFYKISAKYPVEPWDKDGVMEKFVKQQVETKREDWKVGGEAYNSEKEIEKQYSDRPKMVYELNVFYDKFESRKMGTVSYLFRISEYTGGANANEVIQSFTFNKDGGTNVESFLNISDDQVVNNKKIPNDIALSQMILKKSQIDKDNFPDIDMVADGLGLSYLAADGVTLDHKKCNCNGYFYGSNLQNFIVSDEGLTFYFGKGEITARAMGVVGISFDWSELKPFLVAKE
jgi:uncharacterized protein YxeA